MDLTVRAQYCCLKVIDMPGAVCIFWVAPAEFLEKRVSNGNDSQTVIEAIHIPVLCVTHPADCIWLRGDSRISAAEVPEAGQEIGTQLGRWRYVPRVEYFSSISVA